MKGADGLPVFPILRDIIIDGLWEKYPREGVVEEVEPDFVQTLMTTEVDDRVEGVAIEAEPRVAVVKYAGATVGQSLRPTSVVLTVGLMKEDNRTMAGKVGLGGLS